MHECWGLVHGPVIKWVMERIISTAPSFPVKYLYFSELKWKAKCDHRFERLKIMGPIAFFLRALVALRV